MRTQEQVTLQPCILGTVYSAPHERKTVELEVIIKEAKKHLEQAITAMNAYIILPRLCHCASVNIRQIGLIELISGTVTLSSLYRG